MAHLKRKAATRDRKAATATPSIPVKRPWLPASAGMRLLPLLIIAAGLLAFHNSFGGVFVFDDFYAIEGNPLVRQLWPFTGTSFLRSGSLVTLSFSVNHFLGGFQIWGYHLVNLSIHVLAGLTLFGLVRRSLLLSAGGARCPRSAAWIALVVSLVWLVHPVQTESVTYIIQRTESMMGLFYLLTLYCVLRGVEAPAFARWWYAAAVASCALGMASKEVMVTAPILVLLYDRLFLSRSFVGALRQRWGLYVGLVATWVLLSPRVIDLFNFERGSDASVGFAVPGITPLEYARTQPEILLYYLRLSVWPIGQCLDYGWPAATDPLAILLAASIVAGLLIATLWALRRRPGPGYCGAWFFLILAPTSSIVPLKDLAFEHRMYLPLAAVVLLAVLGAEVIWAAVSRRFIRDDFLRTLSTAALVFGLVAALSLLTIRRNEAYRSLTTMWEDVTDKQPESARAHNNLGRGLMFERSPAEALPHLREAVRLKPDFVMAHANLGQALFMLGKPEEAATHLYAAVSLNPNVPQWVRNSLGEALSQQKKPEEASVHFREAIRLDPTYVPAYFNLGNALVAQGKTADAVSCYQEAVRLDPGLTRAHSNLGGALMSLGRVADAIDHYWVALRQEPALALSHNNLGQALVRQGKLAEAIERFREALRLGPELAPVQNNLGVAYLLGGDVKEATGCFKRAIELKPRRASYHRNLAFALHRQGRVDEARAEYRTSLDLDPKWPKDAVERAWLLAVHPEPGRRDGRLAVIWTEQILHAERDHDPRVLDTLAAAYAESGQYDKAVETARRARIRAREGGLVRLMKEIDGRLELYQRHQPFRTAEPR